jgi:hypothetical protein
MKSILDRAFRYTPAASTDIRETFRRIKAEQEANKKEAEEKVKPMVKLKRTA